MAQILRLDADWELAIAELSGSELFAGDTLDLAPIAAKPFHPLGQPGHSTHPDCDRLVGDEAFNSDAVLGLHAKGDAFKIHAVVSSASSQSESRQKT